LNISNGAHHLARRVARAADWITWRRPPGSFERHLARSAPVLDELRARGHDSPNVLALLVVESFYRPAPTRAVEYAFWATASALGRPIDKLSVGRAQLQLIHWRSLGLLEDTRFSRAALAQVRDLEANYIACSRYLARRGMLAGDQQMALATAYTGAWRPHYANLIEAARSALVAQG
jgi:hypothetical protein